MMKPLDRAFALEAVRGRSGGDRRHAADRARRRTCAAQAAAEALRAAFNAMPISRHGVIGGASATRGASFISERRLGWRLRRRYSR